MIETTNNTQTVEKPQYSPARDLVKINESLRAIEVFAREILDADRDVFSRLNGYNLQFIDRITEAQASLLHAFAYYDIEAPVMDLLAPQTPPRDTHGLLIRIHGEYNRIITTVLHMRKELGERGIDRIDYNDCFNAPRWAKKRGELTRLMFELRKEALEKADETKLNADDLGDLNEHPF